MINAMQLTDTFLGALNAGVEAMVNSREKSFQNKLLNQYNHLVDKYNELSSTSCRAMNILNKKIQQLNQENIQLRTEISRLHRQVRK